MHSLNDAPIDKPLVNSSLTGTFGRPPLLSPTTISRELEELPARPPRQRTRLWEFGSNLHCSIIGTCLTTAELRRVFQKLGHNEAPAAAEHDLHASAVLIANKHQDGAK